MSCPFCGKEFDVDRDDLDENKALLAAHIIHRHENEL